MIDPMGSGSTAADDARLELVLAAGASERANRPRHLLIFALVLLGIAIIYALTGVTARGAAMIKVSKARTDAERIIRLADRIATLQAEAQARGLEQDNRIASRLETKARENGLSLGPITDTENSLSSSVKGMLQKKYSAKLINQEPGPLLRWLKTAQESPELPGLEISRISFRPSGMPGAPGAAGAGGAAGWNMDVDFTRWERRK